MIWVYLPSSNLIETNVVKVMPSLYGILCSIFVCNYLMKGQYADFRSINGRVQQKELQDTVDH